MPDQPNKHLNKQKEFIHGLVELLKESLVDMPAKINKQGELTAGLVMLLKKSVASEKKATSEILQTSGGQGEALPRARPAEGEERRLEEAT